MYKLWLNLLTFLLREVRAKGMEMSIELKYNGIELRCHSRSFATDIKFGVDWWESNSERTYTAYMQQKVGSELPDDLNVKISKKEADEIYNLLLHIKSDGVVEL